MAARERDREERDRAMMQDPDRWPCWPMLPMKRYRNQTIEVALVIDAGAEGKIKFLEDQNLFSLPARGSERATALWQQAVERTVDAVLADGWQVD